MCVFVVLRRIWVWCPVLLEGLPPELVVGLPVPSCGEGNHVLTGASIYSGTFWRGREQSPGRQTHPRVLDKGELPRGNLPLCTAVAHTCCLPCAGGEDWGKMLSPRAGEGQKGWSRTRAVQGHWTLPPRVLLLLAPFLR